MGLISSVGKRVGTRAMKGGRGTLALAAMAGLGLAVASEHPVRGSMNFALEAATGTPDADNIIMGNDVRFSDFFMPHWARLGLPPRRFLNSTIMGDAFRKPDDSLMNAARSTMKDMEDFGYTDENYSFGQNLPYRQRVVRPDVSGDIAFGMYNMRRGY